MTCNVELTLQKQEGTPWGFRLQGGVEFEKCLAISSVTDGSPSHLSGLKTGDVLHTINGQEAKVLTHQQGQDALLSSGNTIHLVVQRMGLPDISDLPDLPWISKWRPTVELVGDPAVTPANPGQLYTKTSLVAPPIPEDTHWDVKHNITAKGFQPAANQSGFKSVSAPITKPTTGPTPTGPPQSQECWMCKASIRGVFLQVKGHPIHGECFACCICHSSLKNVGHFLLGGKLYCQTHAMQAQVPGEGGDCVPDQVQEDPANQGERKPKSNLGVGIPQGLAANLARLARRPQGSSIELPSPHSSVQTDPSSCPAAREDKLNTNTAGLALNAQNFTKTFMEQLPEKTTKETSGTPPSTTWELEC